MSRQHDVAWLLEHVKPSTCECGVVIGWAVGVGRGRIPFELEVADDGDLTLSRFEGELLAHVIAGGPVVNEQQLGLDVAVEQRELGPRFRSHWARCPHAAEYRRQAP